jgi:hypothetical protein
LPDTWKQGGLEDTEKKKEEDAKVKVLKPEFELPME